MAQNIRRYFSFFLAHLKIVVLIIIVLGLLTANFSFALKNFTVPSFGKIKLVGVEVYWDSTLENKTEAINWGLLEPGSIASVTLYIKNVSNIRTTLILLVKNYIPSGISEHMDLSWDYNDDFLNPGQVICVNILLTCSDFSFRSYVLSNNVYCFSLDIYFVASELLGNSYL